MVDNQVMCIRRSGAADTNYELELETDNEVYRNRKKICTERFLYRRQRRKKTSDMHCTMDAFEVIGFWAQVSFDTERRTLESIVE